jgi:trk system potassium uptake protein TrkA
MGCGRVGSALAVQLEDGGHEVVIIDISEFQFTRFLPDGFRGRTIVGNGIDQDVQRKAGIEGADGFIAVTAGDNRNVMAAQIAKHIFSVPKVVVRIYDPIRQEMYEKLGLRTVSPTKVVPKLLLDVLNAPEPATASSEA